MKWCIALSLLVCVVLSASIGHTVEPPVFSLMWGTQGAANSQFETPIGIAVGPDGGVYVADAGNQRIQKFDEDGHFITKWGSPGSSNGQFAAGIDGGAPLGLAVDASGRVLAADPGNSRIQRFDGNGFYLSQWGSWGSGDGEFGRGPFGVDVSTLGGSVFVTDGQDVPGPGDPAGDERVQKFNDDGTFVMTWGTVGQGEGEFQAPVDVVVDAEGNIFISDSFNSRVQKFDPDGVFILAWGSGGSGDGQFGLGPAGIALSPDGNLYVVDLINNRIQVFDSGGGFLTKWGSSGTGEGQFDTPFGIAINHDGDVYVADQMNHRVQKFSASAVQVETRTWGRVKAERR